MMARSSSGLWRRLSQSAVRVTNSSSSGSSNRSSSNGTRSSTAGLVATAARVLRRAAAGDRGGGADSSVTSRPEVARAGGGPDGVGAPDVGAACRPAWPGGAAVASWAGDLPRVFTTSSTSRSSARDASSSRYLRFFLMGTSIRAGGAGSPDPRDRSRASAASSRGRARTRQGEGRHGSRADQGAIGARPRQSPEPEHHREVRGRLQNRLELPGRRGQKRDDAGAVPADGAVAVDDDADRERPASIRPAETGIRMDDCHTVTEAKTVEPEPSTDVRIEELDVVIAANRLASSNAGSHDRSGDQVGHRNL